jgi:hypothetical protein
MDIEINEVQEIIKNLESRGELSIKEEKYLKIAKLCGKLAAENVGLSPLIAENWNMRDLLRQLMAGRPGGVYFNKWEKLIVGVLNETPATDRFVAGIKADGVEEFSKTLEGAADICGKSKAWEAQENLLDFAERGFDFAKQLREGAK